MQMDQPESWGDAPAAPPTNALGVAGFILAFCLSPIGLILSLAALAKPPRGFAVAGVVVGAIGTCFWALAILIGVTMGPMFVKTTHVATAYERVSHAVGAYKTAHAGELPGDLTAAGLTVAEQTDPWGVAYRFALSEDRSTWTLTSAGPDGVLDNDDDIILPAGLDQWGISNAINKAMQAHYKGGSGRRPAVRTEATDQPQASPADPEQK